MSLFSPTSLGLGLVLGVGVGLLVAQPAPAPLHVPPRLDPSEAAPADGPSTRTAPAHPSAETAAQAEAFAALPEGARHRARELSASLRESAQAQYDAADRVAIARVQATLARERQVVEDASRGGTMAFLESLERQFVPPFELLGSDEAFGAHFRRHAEGSEHDGERIDGSQALGDGDTVRYPAGRFEVSYLRTQAGEIPKDLLLIGAGMDETLLVLASDITSRAPVHSLTLRDATIHCNDNYFTRLRSAPFTIRLERCRVIGFDMGAGGSVMLSGRVGAVFATGCRFEAGFGRSPGSGNLLRVRSLFLARFVDCDFVGPLSDLVERHRGAVVFERCRFTRLHERVHRHLAAQRDHASFVDCTFGDPLPQDVRRSDRRPVASINPAWGR